MSSIVSLLDIGANMIDPMFRGEYRGKTRHPSDLNLVLERAWATGLREIIVTAGSKTEAQEAINFCAETDERLFSTVGVHPTRCNEFLTSDSYLDELLQICKEGKESGRVVAVGEFGLDYERTNFCDIETQKEWFQKQFVLSEETKLPLFLHNRNSTKDLIEILNKNRERYTGGVVHSFDGTVQEMKELVGMGLYIGINGCSLRTEDSLNVVKEIPKERLLIETDAPWCSIKKTHPGYKFVKTHWETKKEKKFVEGKCVNSRCEPCHLLQVLEVVSSVRGEEDLENFATTIYENSKRLFFSNSQ